MIAQWIKNINGEQILSFSIRALICIVVLIVIVNCLSTILIARGDSQLRKKMVVLKILPKANIDLKETERLLRNLHSMLLNTKFRKYIYGRQYISFEIAARNIEVKQKLDDKDVIANKDIINFFITVPKDLKDRIVDRIYSSYPELSIQELTEDYIPDNKDPKYTAELSLAAHHTLKIKSFDITDSILAAMKDLGKNDFVSVQVLMRPLDNKWQKKGRKDLEDFERKGVRIGTNKGSGGKGEAIADKMDSAVMSVMDQIEQGLAGGRSSRTIIQNVPPKAAKTKLDRKEIVAVADKINDPGFDVVLRLVASGKYKKVNTARITALVAAFTELNAENKIKRNMIGSHKAVYKKFQERRMKLDDSKNIFIPSELASFALKLPGADLIDKYTEIERLQIKEFQAPSEAFNTNKGVIFGENIYRAHKNLVEIKMKDLTRHVVVQGKTGTGKSEWFKTVFIDHISNKYDDNGKLIKKGLGGMVLEPHGKLANELMQIIPEDRRKDVIVFDLFSKNPLPFNFCKVKIRDNIDETAEQQEQKALEEALEIFKMNFSDIWSAKNENYIEKGIKVLMDLGLTMLELPRLFSSSSEFRDSVIPRIKDKQLKKWWEDKFKVNDRGKLDSGVESTAQSVEYKIEKFLRSRELQRSLGQDDCIDFKEIMDENKIIIFKFSKQKMTKDAVSFMGGIALKLIISAAFARDKNRWDDTFLLGIDEAQNFLGESIKDILWELRKYGLALLLMHQELNQMNKVEGLLDAIYNMVGTKITFTAGEADAPWLSKIYAPNIDKDDLVSLPSRYGYCKLLINGSTSDVFNFYSIDSPQVSKEVAEQSIKEIEGYNAEGRMSVDELDKMIAARYGDDEDFDDYDEQSFVQKANVLNMEKEDVGVKVLNMDKDPEAPEDLKSEEKTAVKEKIEMQKQPEELSKEIENRLDFNFTEEIPGENQEQAEVAAEENEMQVQPEETAEEIEIQDQAEEAPEENEMQGQSEEEAAEKNEMQAQPEEAPEDENNRRIDFNFDEEVNW